MKGWKTVLRAGRWLRSRGRPRGLILLYHRVAEPAADPYGICVSPANFEAHMAALRRVATPLSLDEMLAAARSGALPPRAVAVTFDDGYVDNLTEAQPILEKYRIPATVFVVAGMLDQEAFWWDELVRAVCVPAALPGTLALTIAGRLHSWTVDGAAAGRRRLLAALHSALRDLPAEQRRPLLGQLWGWAGEPAWPAAGRPLTGGELVDLAGREGITIGAHTMSHRSLAGLPPGEQRLEIGESKSRLEQLVGRPVTSFSYPYGMPRDVSAVTVDLVQEAGFPYACTNTIGVVCDTYEPFRLPRYWISNWTPDIFIRRIGRWL